MYKRKIPETSLSGKIMCTFCDLLAWVNKIVCTDDKLFDG